MSVTKLPSRHWTQLQSVFEDEFNSDLPNGSNAEIRIANDKGARKGFILTEQVKMVGQIYIYPDFRGRESMRTVMQLINSIKKDAKADKQSICTVASEKRFRRLYKSLGMEEIPGDIYRINY